MHNDMSCRIEQQVLLDTIAKVLHVQTPLTIGSQPETLTPAAALEVRTVHAGLSMSFPIVPHDFGRLWARTTVCLAASDRQKPWSRTQECSNSRFWVPWVLRLREQHRPHTNMCTQRRRLTCKKTQSRALLRSPISMLAPPPVSQRSNLVPPLSQRMNLVRGQCHFGHSRDADSSYCGAAHNCAQTTADAPHHSCQPHSH